jgi:hypothetical protein
MLTETVQIEQAAAAFALAAVRGRVMKLQIAFRWQAWRPALVIGSDPISNPWIGA